MLKVISPSYLWVRNGERLREDQFSILLARTFKKYCGADWGLRPYRQATISISREFIPPQMHLGGGDNTVDLATDHGTRISRGNYGLVEGDLPYLTSDAVWEYRVICREWHNVCGVGLLPPPKPIRLARGELSSEVSMVGLKETLQSVVNTTINDMETRIVDRLLPVLTDKVMSLLDFRRKNPIPTPVTPVHYAPISSLPPSSLPSQLSINLAPMPSTPSIIEILDSPPHPNPSSEDENPRRARYRGPVITSDELDEPSPLPLRRLVRREAERSPVVLVPSTSETGSSIETAMEAKAREGIKKVLGDPNAQEKSPEQLEALVGCIEKKEDLNVVLGTAGGKSLLWQAMAKLFPEEASIIVVPFRPLLMQHVQKSKSLGIVSFEYRSGCFVPEGFQNIFLQPEVMKGNDFKG